MVNDNVQNTGLNMPEYKLIVPHFNDLIQGSTVDSADVWARYLPWVPRPFLSRTPCPRLPGHLARIAARVLHAPA